MSEIRALLLTDVVDSTQLSETLGDAGMAQLWAAHDRLARDLLQIWRGREIDKTDGMLLLFDAAPDAAAFALAYHRALGSLNPPLKARAGLHVGPVILRENSAVDVARGAKPLEVDGLAKPTAARVMSLAQGGQTLLTLEARAALGETRLRLQSHGHWRMKGVTEPMELFEVGDVDTTFVPPPDSHKVYRVVRNGTLWLPARQIANNLPQQLNSFVGRARELATCRNLLENTRLLTLTGSGGCGKTRLSLQLATTVMGDHSDGVWLVELAALADPGLAPQTVATVLGLKEASAKPIEQALAEHLKDKRVLLLLDNCEHLLDACAQLANALSHQCPNLTILATSREALGIAGEQAYRVPSLSLPDPKQAHTPASVARFEAVRLFIDRALLARADFEVTPQNAAAVASICHRLDGIPLALELAAARVRSLSVEEINNKLDQRFRLLTGGARTALPRQQTLRSLIDWSYDLLSAAEQALFRGLSVFAGGWTLEAAEDVCSEEGIAKVDVLDLLTAITDKSLVLVEERNGESRYRLLETVRQYARERLLESGGGEAVRTRHRDYFLALAEETHPKLRGREQAMCLRRLETEHENLRASLEWSLADADPRVGLRLCSALQLFWIMRGHFAEGRRWCAQVLAKDAVEEQPQLHANALGAAGVLAYRQIDYMLARELLGQSLAIRRRLGDRKGIGIAVGNLGMIAADEGDFASAEVLHEESLAIARELGNRVGVAASLANLGIASDEQGDTAAARARFGECLAISRELGDQHAIAVTLHRLAMIHSRERDHAAAKVLYVDSLMILRDLGLRGRIVYSLEALGTVTAALGSPVRAARMWGAEERLREEIGLPKPPDELQHADQCIRDARAALGDDTTFDRAWQEGRAMTQEQAIEYALAKPDD